MNIKIQLYPQFRISKRFGLSLQSKNPIVWRGGDSGGVYMLLLYFSYSYEHQRSNFFQPYLVSSCSQCREAPVMPQHAFFPRTYDPKLKTTSISIRTYQMDLLRMSFPTFTEMLKTKLYIILHPKGVIIIFL